MKNLGGGGQSLALCKNGGNNALAKRGVWG